MKSFHSSGKVKSISFLKKIRMNNQTPLIMKKENRKSKQTSGTAQILLKSVLIRHKSTIFKEIWQMQSNRWVLLKGWCHRWISRLLWILLNQRSPMRMNKTIKRIMSTLKAISLTITKKKRRTQRRTITNHSRQTCFWKNNQTFLFNTSPTEPMWRQISMNLPNKNYKPANKMKPIFWSKIHSESHMKGLWTAISWKKTLWMIPKLKYCSNIKIRP